MSPTIRTLNDDERELTDHSPQHRVRDEGQKRWTTASPATLPAHYTLNSAESELSKDGTSFPMPHAKVNEHSASAESVVRFPAESPVSFRHAEVAGLQQNLSSQQSGGLSVSTTTKDLKESFSGAFREDVIPITSTRAVSRRSTFSGPQPVLGGKSVPSLPAGIVMNSFLEDGGPGVTSERKLPSKFWERDPLPGESDIGQELGDNAPIWEKYRDSAQEHDKTMTAGWNQAMDVLLVFAALFSAILTAFIIEFHRWLQPDHQYQSVAFLANIAMTLHCVANGSICTELPTMPLAQFQPSTSSRWTNGLWFTSLTLSLSVSTIAILVKQWIHAYNSGLTGLPKTYMCIRQFRYNGIQKWHMSGIIAALPTAMYLAVLLFFAGLLVLLWSLDTVIYYICIAVLVVTGIGYITSTVLPLFDPSCPFRTPASHALDKICQALLFYMMHIWHLFQFGVLAVLLSWSYFLSLFSFSWVLQVRFNHLKGKYMKIQNALMAKLDLSSQGEREQKKIHSEVSELNAHALLWLSHTYVQDTQDLVTQSIAGLNCDVVTKQFLKSFNGIHWPSQFLVETFNNPNMLSSTYHGKLASYAQAYLITAQLNSDWSLNTQETQNVCDALQWYPVLLPMRYQPGTPKIPVEYLQQGISELAQSLRIVTCLGIINDHCFQIVVHLLLHSTLTMYVLYSQNSTVQSQLLEHCFETLQIWMREQDILKQQPQPYFLQPLCTILQIFTGVTQTSALRSIWSKDRQEERTWVLLLKGLISHFHQNDIATEEQEFQRWKLLHNALIECTRLLSEDRITLESVLNVFLKSPKKEAWSAEDGEQGYPFSCLDTIGHLLTPQDTLAITRSFNRPWSETTGVQLCAFLHKQCQSYVQAQALLSSDIFPVLLEHVAICRSFPALWVICMLLETLSRIPSSMSDLEMVKQHKVLWVVNKMLHQEIQDHILESWHYSEWSAIYSLTASCNMLYRTYREHVISSGILNSLYSLSIFLSTSEYAYMKETQNFMHVILTLMEDGTFESEAN